MEFRLQRHDAVVSTNALVKEALEAGAPEGLVVRSAVQSGGYGRQGRRWSSPAGGLYQSLLLRPVAPMPQLPTLGLVVALAMVRALGEAAPAAAGVLQVKWPNDVMADGAKMVGISCEGHGGGLCIGTGVNVMRPAEEAPLGGKNRPAYLEDYLPEGADGSTVDAVGDGFLAQFAADYALWQRCGFEAFADEYRRRHCLEGRAVKLALPDGTPLGGGTVRGIDGSGCLVVDDGCGLRPYASGEVHIL